MKRRLFTDADVTPTEAMLRKGLGPAMDFYHGVVSNSRDYRKQWQFSRGNGWTLKVDDTRKALYYLIPLEDGIEISLTIRDSERELFLKNGDIEVLRPLLQGATKYSEGFALRFDIETAAQYAPVARFIAQLMEIRAAIKPPPVRTKPAHKAEKSRGAHANTTGKR